MKGTLKIRWFVIPVVVAVLVVGAVVDSLAQDKQKVKIAHFYDPMGSGDLLSNFEWLMRQIGGFEAEFSNLKVEDEIYIWNQIDTKAMTDFRAGIPHDVMLSSPQLMPMHFLVGDYLDLSPYINQWTVEEFKDFSWSPVWQKAVQGDVQLAITTGTHTRAVAYRRDMFEEVGLDPNRPPQTLEELVEYAKRLTRDIDGDGKTDIWGLGMFFGPSRATIELFVAPFIWHFGGQLWDPKTKRAVFASEAGVKAAQFVYDLVYTYKVTPEFSVTGGYDDRILADFLQGKTAMSFGYGSYWIGALESEGFIEGCFPATSACTPIKADIFLNPTAPQAAFTNAWYFSIHKLSKNPDASFELIEYLLRPEILNEFPDAGLPARLSLWERPGYQTPFYQKWLNAARNGRAMPPTAHYGELADIVAVAFQEILVNQAPIAATLKKFEDQYNARFAGE
ncbi:MAG: extracellular solute-binding protein [Candidatus Bipolaricaulia bacterium]